MVAINHALTGAVIGLTVSQPLAAIPIAILSHFTLDSLPHFGFSKVNERGQKFIALLLADAILCGLLVIWLFLSGSPSWLLASITAFIATSPDFMWAPDFYRHKRHGKIENHKSNFIKKFHSAIQWYQRPPGAVVEILYFVLVVTTLVKLV